LKLRGALLGAGNIALRGHAPQWTGDATLGREVEIVAAADLSRTNLDAARDAFPGVHLYEQAEQLLACEPLDFVDVCTPPFTHRALVEAAAARGLHVLCEKPIAQCLGDAEAIAATVRAANLVFVPCHQYHHSPQWQAVVRLLPRIGRVHLVEYEVHRTEANPGNPNWSPAWRTDRQLAGGGILFDHGAHIFYQLRSVLGEPAALQATVRTLRHAQYGVEDSAFVVLDFGDRLAEVRLTWAARRRSIRFLFVGADGELVGDDERVVVRAATSEEVSFAEGMSRNSSHSEWYAPLMRDFVERVRAKDSSSGPLDEALYVTRLITRAYQSSDERRAIPFETGALTPVQVGPALSAMTDVVSRVLEPESETGPAGGEIEAVEPPPVQTARRTPWLVRAAGVAMLAVAGWWAVHDVDWAGMPAALATVSPGWVGVAALVNLLAVYAMAARWRALLNPLAPLVTQAQAFKALLMGFAVSTIVPARAGELARAEWLARRSGLPRATVLGSIVLDQLVNAVGLFVGIAALPFVLEMPRWLHSGLWLALLVFLAAATLVFVFQPRAGQATLAGAQPQGKAGAVAGFLARARLGLAAVRDRRALARSLGGSLLAWVVEMNVVLITLHAFGLHPSLGVSLLVLMAVNLALVVPFAPPGNLGTLEVGAMLALMQYGVPKEQALAFALVYHLLQVVPIGIAGLSLAGHSLMRPSSAPPGRPASNPTN
jgi:uncharacterized protein (TIRG00374 family)